MATKVTTKPKRKKTPPKIETSIFVKSRRRCSLCFQLNSDTEVKLGQVAHLDDDPSNFDEDNLVWLCFDHHSQYDSKTSQHKNFTEGEVKEARKSLYLWAERDKPYLPPRTFKTHSTRALQLEATVSGFARHLRGEGYTELLGEIDLKITGRTESKGGSVAELVVTLTTNITNRFDQMGMGDVALISDKGKVASRGRIVSLQPARFNRITFEHVILTANKGVLDVRFSIVGLRANAQAVGLGVEVQRAPITATVEVSIYPGGKILSANPIQVGLVRPRTTPL